MGKIYDDAEDKNVAVRVVYASAAEGNLFSDAAKTVKMTADEVRNAYLKGMVVDLAGEYLNPIGLKTSGSGVVVSTYQLTKVVTFKSSEVA